VAAAATLLLGFALSTIGNAISYAKPHSQGFTDAEKQAKDLQGEVGRYQSDYGTQKSKFTSTRDGLMKLVDGRRDLFWLEVYNAVLDCVPRDEGDEQDEVDIQRRHLMSLTHFTCEKKGDVGEWYKKLTDDQKELMSAEDKTAPGGEGYIFTINGSHWHKGDDFQDERLAYVVHTLLKNLQQPTIQREGFPVRDVRRLGISHPVVIAHQTGSMPYDPLGEQKKRQMSAASGGRFGAAANPFAGPGTSFAPASSGLGGAPFAPMRSGVPGPAGTGPGPGGENVRMIEQTDFTVQFVLKTDFRDPAKRPALAETQSGETPPAAQTPPAQ
jgi:type IV pilus assembly protein PilM